MFKVLTDYKLCPDNRLTVPGFNYSEEFVRANYGLTGTSNKDFNKLAYSLFDKEDISILELGCGDGNFINDCVEDGKKAIGLDGFWILEKYKPGRWALLPNNLFSCDVCHPFTVLFDERPIKFDLITSFEFMEHLFEEDVDGTIKNIANHLNDDGYYICSISHAPDYGHFCIKDRDWWLEKFSKCDLIEINNLYPVFRYRYLRNLPSSEYFILKHKKQ